MVTTDGELKSLQDENADKRKKLAEIERKAAELQRLVQNGQTKSALEAESKQLDAQVAQAEEQLKALEDLAGVSADDIKLPTTRSTSEEQSDTAATEAPITLPTEAASATASSKRGSK